MGVESLTEHKKRYDGTTIRVMSSLNPPTVSSYAYISSPFVEEEEGEEVGNPVIYLVTIAVPMRADSDTVEYTDYDADNKHIYKTYAYRLDEKKSTLKPIDLKIVLTTNDFTTGSGIVLPLQEGLLLGKQIHYAQLSHIYTHEEELGSVDWKTFQDGGGWDLYNLGVPDRNTYWGYSIVRFMKMATYGSDKAIKSPNPLTALSTTYAARKNYVVNGKTITYVDLVYQRNVIQEYFAPAYWNYNYGEAMCSGIVEVLNPNYRMMYKHYINSLDYRTNATKSVLIAEDEHKKQGDADFDNLTWKYHIPIIAVTDQKALMRKVRRTGTDKTCWTAELIEDLRIGTSDSGTILREITYNTSGGISTTSVKGSDTIGNYQTQSYTLDGCQQGDQTFTFSGGGGYTVSGNSIIAGSSVCGVITATGTCVSCGITASKEVVATGGHWVSVGNCGVTDPSWYIYAGLESNTVQDGGHLYVCAFRDMVQTVEQGCCDALTYECTGDCSPDAPCDTGCTDFKYPSGKCYKVHGLAGVTCYEWSCY
jgi:hypothetical protein